MRRDRPGHGAWSHEEPMNEMRFETTLNGRPRGGFSIDLPFDPDDTWGAKDRHYVTGSIAKCALRGRITLADARYVLELGPTWTRDPRIRPGLRVEVVLRPEGPQLDSMTPDIAQAIASEPDVQRFFESLATFY